MFQAMTTFMILRTENEGLEPSKTFTSRHVSNVVAYQLA